MSFIFKIIAKNPPMALFVLAAFMILTGTTTNNQELTNWGSTFLSWGIVLQIVYLIVRYNVFRD